MKHLLLLLLLTLALLGQPNISSYTLPQDYNHFTYFLQKLFKKKGQKISIITKNFNLRSLKSIIIKNRTSHFEIFTNEVLPAQSMIRGLALYPHIKIYLCQDLSKQMIVFNNNVIKSLGGFDVKTLTKIDQKVKISPLSKEDKYYLRRVKKVCKNY